MRSKTSHMHFEATFTKNDKTFLVAQTFGKKVTVKDSLSDLSIEVAKGVKALVMQSINANFYLLNEVIPKNECLVAPVFQLHMVEEGKTETTDTYKYKINIPHYISRNHMLSSIKVKYGSLKHSHLMTDVVETRNPRNSSLPCYKINKKHITIYANHFCDVVCTSTEKVCTSKLLALPFGLIYTLPEHRSITCIKLKTFLCSYLYNNSNLKKVWFLYFNQICC